MLHVLLYGGYEGLLIYLDDILGTSDDNGIA